MRTLHPKTIRRKLLQALYTRYMKDPLDMLGPEDVLEATGLSREDLPANMYYLSERGYIELMHGYRPPMFAGVRLTAKGVDLVENQVAFDCYFPAEPDATELGLAPVPVLIEQLVEEVEFAPLDGEARHALLRDVRFLRDETSRPAHRWRMDVIETVLGWLEAPFGMPEDTLPSITPLRKVLQETER